jgi:peptidoglycan hydrolase CwlO-like protein
MLICNCTLCYTNPDSCKTCSAYIKEFGNNSSEWEWKTDWWNIYFPKTVDVKLNYDSDRYELVEKKDWKVNNLKEKIKGIEEALENNKKSLKFYQDLITMNLERIEELNKELKELEKE